MAALSFQKKLLVSAIILAVLVIVYAMGIVFSPAGKQKREAERPLIPMLNKDQISRIELEGGEENVILKREQEEWTVRLEGIYFPASEARVDSFLDNLVSLKRSRLITDNPELWEGFDLGEEAGPAVKLYDANERKVVELIVGKEGIGGRGNYLRLEGSNEVIQSDRSISTYLDRGSKYWSDLRLIPEELAGRDIIMISIKSSFSFSDDEIDRSRSLRYTLVLNSDQQGSAWRLDGREEVSLSERKVDRLAGALASFEGTEFAAGISEAEAGFSTPRADIGFSTADNRRYRLLVGKELAEKKQFYVKLEGQTHSYLVASWRLGQILKPLSELQTTGEEQPGD